MPARAWLVGVFVLLLPLLAACGPDEERSSQVAWQEDLPTIAVDASPTLEATPETPAATGGTHRVPVVLTSREIEQFRPNELGRIPILMYHGFSTDPASLNDWIRSPESLRDDLEWLYERGFYVVSMMEMITNEISAPPGKHPVVLTFDDASSGQFRLLRDEDGELYPDPVTAVGVMEAFFAEHPDFGRGGFFAVLPYNCFKREGEESTCEERLTWLDDHGYELGNHTWTHENLADVSDEVLKAQVARTQIWLNERVHGDGNLSNVLVLPFGNFPESARQRQMLRDGFWFEGQHIALDGLVGVHGGPSPSPSSGEWTRWRIARFNTDDTTWGYWKRQIDEGAITLYTSDGNPGTVTIPEPIPADLTHHWDPEWATSYGMQVIRYDATPAPPVTGSGTPAPPQPAAPDAQTRRWSGWAGSRPGHRPGTPRRPV